MIGNFNEEAQNALLNAKMEMLDLGHPYIGTEHLLLAILKSDSNISNRLSNYNLTYNVFREELCKVVGTTDRKSELFLYTPLLRKVLENAIIDSRENNDGEVTLEHLFFAMIEEGEGIAIRTIIGLGIDIEAIYDDFSVNLVKKCRKNKKKKLMICDLGEDITNEAKEGRLDPVIGRDKEVKRVMEILCRRTKNNPILIGEAGVGKTAIVEELSRLIASSDVPNNLMNKKIISLDMATMVAGTKYRGEFEERMKKVIKEIEDNQEIILFIDEIHTLVGAGGAEGAIDASNILKPALARGKIRCIGATTTEEYKKFIEKDSALERRFQKVIVNEPSIQETKNILSEIKLIYEKYHGVSISDNIIEEIVNLSEKYIFDRNRPDKQIDVLDEVCSKVSMKENKYDSKLKNIKRQLSDLEKEKNSYIIDNNIEMAYKLRKKETKLASVLNEIEISKGRRGNVVTIQDVASVISNRTNIPIYEIMASDVNSINDIGSELKKRVIGQNDAINTLIQATKRIRLADSKKCYSFMFVGPSGVGKSMLAKEYARGMFGEDNFIKLDMSEYSDSTSVNKILGSSPGYVGYDDNRNILEEVRSKPNSVILLDEIDKAHPSVINLFYQILEEGKIKDARGRTIRFNNNVIIMTSNVGFEKNAIGFNKNVDSNVYSYLKNRFNIAFVNRIDNILIFNRLKEDDIRVIAGEKLEKIKNKYQNIDITYASDLVSEIVKKSQYNDFGARRIEKIIASSIESRIIDAMINGNSSITICTLDKERDITLS